jgi:hypothetical protein
MKDYLKDLMYTFREQPYKILCTSILIWIILPTLIFAGGGIALLFKIITLDIFTNLFANAIIPWWTAIILDFKKFILEYIVLFIITLILANHKIIKTIGFNELIKKIM